MSKSHEWPIFWIISTGIFLRGQTESIWQNHKALPQIKTSLKIVFTGGWCAKFDSCQVFCLAIAPSAAAEALQEGGLGRTCSAELPMQSLHSPHTPLPPEVEENTWGTSISTATCSPHTLPLLPQSLSLLPMGFYVSFFLYLAQLLISQYDGSPSTTVAHVDDKPCSTLGKPRDAAEGKRLRFGARNREYFS